MLQDLTGIDPLEIPLDSKEVMSLFQNTSALGIKPEDIGGTKLGALGIPEFGTDFAMQMLMDTKPQYFSDLVRIAGLAHGTDVWLNNAQDLIREGKPSEETISTRDDIMTNLIAKGVDPSMSFKLWNMFVKARQLKAVWKHPCLKRCVPQRCRNGILNPVVRSSIFFRRRMQWHML